MMKHLGRATILTATAFAMLAGVGTANASEIGDAIDLPYVSERALSDLSDAKPMTNPLRRPNTSKVRARVGTGDLMPGVAKRGGKLRQDDDEAHTRAFGSFGIPYTTTRVQLGRQQGASGVKRTNHLSITYPYRTVGKLTF